MTITSDISSRLKAVQTAYQRSDGLAELVHGAQGGSNVLLYAWSASSLSWQVVGLDASGNLLTTGGGGGGGGAVTIADGADVAEGSTADGVWASGSGTVVGLLKRMASGFTMLMDYDVNGNMIYFGKAATGSVAGSGVWQIRRLDYNVNGDLLDILWAGGSQSFSQIWTNRVALSYS